MTKSPKRRTSARLLNDPSAGGKRSAMGLEEDPAEPYSGDAVAADFDLAGLGEGLARGVTVIAGTVKTLSASPGVYRMLNRKGDAVYVGKARNLKRRVTNYTQIAKLPRRLQRMVAETVAMEVVETHTEVEALLLESNLIKRLMPRYNVLLRDDKSFPYILLTGDQAIPLITKHRGAHTREGDYFGPFASAGAVNRTITALERAFLLRSCSDAVYAARTRPCLMYQIRRCSAPCVERISAPDYRDLVTQARDFLTGRSQEVQQLLARKMEAASAALDFETAAVFRDRIRALAHIQSHQDINIAGVDNADVVAAHEEGGQICIQVFFFRAGRNYGNRAYFPSHDKSLAVEEVLGAFVAQFYDNKPVPRLVLLSHRLAEQALIAEALSLKAERKVELSRPQRGAKRKLIDNALHNAREALARRLAESSSQRKLLEQLAEIFGLDATPDRIEIYDNSHIQGSEPYGCMVVAGAEGFRKNAYRKFKIKDPGTVAGDDYAMMREVLTRRFTRLVRESEGRDGKEGEDATWPDLILIDGGAGQLKVALEVLEELGIDNVTAVGVAKG
ncbi:MAG: excinuclease ABC subunit UvrC, partial [Kiloniellaceae bacterium]